MIRFDRAGYPFFAVSLVLAALSWAWVSTWLALPFLVLAAFFLFFFRDPDRTPATIADAVVSPADGRVLVAGPAVASAAPEGEWQQISIFLSPMDVHVNRVPVSGRVTRVSFTPGKFLPAYRTRRSDNQRAQRNLDRSRRKTNRCAADRRHPGAPRGLPAEGWREVQAGERYGVMKFGSRMDVFLPLSAEILVEVGATVRAAETVIAVLH